MTDMTDNTAQLFDPNAPVLFFSGPELENVFAQTPANVTNEFIAEAMQNVTAPASAATSVARSNLVRDSGANTPASMLGRPAAAANTTATKRKRVSRMRVTNVEENSESNVSPPAAAPPAAMSSGFEEVPAPKKRKRQPGKKQLNARVIPRSLADCDDADKELIALREAGKEWKVIRARWFELTGEQTATSTLPNRYARLKSNFTVIKEEDNGLLIAAKREVEESFEGQKWDLIARLVQQKGGENYAGVVLRRQYKKLMVSNGAVPPPGVQDPDFAIELPESDGE